jgi:phage terminase Nu1 subunit (DNA packaging protein)
MKGLMMLLEDLEQVRLKRKDFADLIGVDAGTVGRWVKSGSVSDDKTLGVEVFRSIRNLIRQRSLSVGGDGDEGDLKSANLKADTQLKLNNARMRLLEIQLKERELVDLEQAHKWAGKFVSMTRDFLDGLPDHLERGGSIKDGHMDGVIKRVNAFKRLLASQLENMSPDKDGGENE